METASMLEIERAFSGITSGTRATLHTYVYISSVRMDSMDSCGWSSVKV